MAFAGVSAASAGMLLLLLVLASRRLGEIEYGKFSFSLGLGAIFETLMDFGLHQVAIRAVARDRSVALRILRNSLGLKLIWTAGALAFLVITATVLRGETDVRLTCYLVGGSLVLRSYTLTVRGVLQGLEQFGWDSVVVIADRLALLIAGAVALQAGTGLYGLALAFVVSRLITLVAVGALAHWRIGPVGISYDRAFWAELQRTAIPLGLFLVVINLYSRIDTVMLGVLRTDAETGIYQNAYSVYEGLTYLPSVIAAVLSPRLSSYFVTDPRRHRRMALGGVAVSVGLALIVGSAGVVTAEPLMTLLFGAVYRQSAEPFRILSAGLSLVYAIWILHVIAISMDRERLLVTASVVGLVAKVGVNAYAIPHAGPTGAAVAVIVGEAISAVVLVVGLLRPAGRPPIRQEASGGMWPGRAGLPAPRPHGRGRGSRQLRSCLERLLHGGEEHIRDLRIPLHRRVQSVPPDVGGNVADERRVHVHQRHVLAGCESAHLGIEAGNQGRAGAAEPGRILRGNRRQVRANAATLRVQDHLAQAGNHCRLELVVPIGKVIRAFHNEDNFVAPRRGQ